MGESYREIIAADPELAMVVVLEEGLVRGVHFAPGRALPWLAIDLDAAESDPEEGDILALEALIAARFPEE